MTSPDWNAPLAAPRPYLKAKMRELQQAGSDLTGRNLRDQAEWLLGRVSRETNWAAEAEIQKRATLLNKDPVTGWDKQPDTIAARLVAKNLRV
jgi:hypothetical protein